MNPNLSLEMQTDFAIVGGGPAGLSAAATAAQLGLDGCLIDRNDQLGGQFSMAQDGTHDRGSSNRPLQAIRRHIEVLENSNWRIVHPGIIDRSTPDQVLHICASGNWLHLKYKTLLVATGASERIRPFKGWTLPGVITIGAAVRMAVQDQVAPGFRVLVAGSGPLLLSSAAQLIRRGVRIIALVEAAPRGQFISQGILAMASDPSRIVQARDDFLTLKRAKVPLLVGHSLVEVKGDGHVEKAITAEMNSQGHYKPGVERTWDVDAVCVSHGLEPDTRLSRALNCDLAYDPIEKSFYVAHGTDMVTSQTSIYVAGEAAGLGGVKKALIEGEVAGLSAAISCNHTQTEDLAPRLDELNKVRRKTIHQYRAIQAAFLSSDRIPVSTDPKTIICRCEDVTLAVLHEAIQEGDGTLRDLKMRTRLGMGMCQGRMCETNACHALASYTNQRPEQIEPLHVRPPLEPLSLKMIAGLNE